MQRLSFRGLGRVSSRWTVPPVLLALVLGTPPGLAQATQKPKTAAPPPPRSVTVGPFSLAVAAGWSPFGASEAAQLRRQYAQQSQEIYRQFAGADDPSKTVDLSALQIATGGAFIVVAFSVPPTSDLIALLKSQVDDKMAFGVREGYIRRYLGTRAATSSLVFCRCSSCLAICRSTCRARTTDHR